MRILIVANSQGSSIGVAPGQNYPALVGQCLGPRYDVRQLVVSGWSLAEVLDNLVDNVIAVKPDLAIFHMGIVECTQRILSAREKALCGFLPFGRKLTATLYDNRARVISWRKRLGIAWRVTKPDVFARLLEQLRMKLDAAGISCTFVPIPMFPDGGASMGHPFVNEDATLYNSLLASYDCIDLGDAPEPHYYQTGTVHFTEAGHQWLAHAVVRDIQRRGVVAA